MMNFDRRNFARGRRQIVRERRGQDIAGLVVDDFFQERVSDALGDTAVDLPVDDQRIDQPSGVFGHQKLFDDDAPGLDIHLDHGDVAGIGKGSRRIIGRTLDDARRDLALEAMNLMIGGARQRLERDRTIGAGNPRDIGFEHDVVGRRLEQETCHLHELGPHLVRCQQRSATGDDQRPAGEGAPAVRRAIGIAVHDLDAVRRGAELVGDDLRQRGAQALAVRGSSDPRLDEAGRVHRHLDGFPAGRHFHAAGGEGRRAVSGALRKSREAETEITLLGARLGLAATECRDVDGFHRRVHGFDIGRLVEHQSHRGRVGKGLDQVTAADLDRIEAESSRRLVHQPLDGEGDHRTGDAAIRRHRTGMGHDSA